MMLQALFYVGMIIDGDSAQGNIRSTKPLVQMYQKDTGKCVPDWSVAANQPVIYPVIRSGNENVIKPIVSGTEKWHYNNTPYNVQRFRIGYRSGCGSRKMQTTTYNNGAVNVPALKIVGNLASASNMDADTIRMDGEIEASGIILAIHLRYRLLSQSLVTLPITVSCILPMVVLSMVILLPLK